MKAQVLEEIGKLEYKEVPTPTPAEGEVLVEVKACGICGSDIPRAYVNGAHKLPLIIGHEFSGRVITKETVESVINASKEDNPPERASLDCYIDEALAGKRVGIFPLIPCRSCEPCKNKQYEMCKNYNYLGSRTNGGFAQYVCVPKRNLIELPDGVSYEEAAMLEPMAVAVHAMRQIIDDNRDITNDYIVVWGLGTIGLFLTMFLKERGALDRLLVIGNKDSQKEKLIQLGLNIDNFCDSRSENISDWIKEKTSGHGADFFFEVVGKLELIETIIDSATPGGSICLVGNPHSDLNIKRDIYWNILRKQLKLSGTWNSSFLGVEDPESQSDDWHYVLDKLSKKVINPSIFITHKFSLEEITEGFEIMRDKKEDYIKVMAIS